MADSGRLDGEAGPLRLGGFLAVPQLLEDGAEATPGAVESSTRGDRDAAEHGRDLRRRQPLPFGEQEHLAVAWPEPAKRLMDDRLLSGRGRRLVRCSRLEPQPLVQCDPAPARPPLVRDHPPGLRVQPHARRVAGGEVVESAPRREEHLGRGILRVARRRGPPAAVRDDVRTVGREQRFETPPSLRFAFLHPLDLPRYRIRPAAHHPVHVRGCEFVCKAMCNGPVYGRR
jgi:hypothetical protein